jgi:hypothetical protein
MISDHVQPIGEPRRVAARLHWLLPDWKWKVAGQELRLASPHGTVTLDVSVGAPTGAEISIVRAGKVVHGRGAADPVLGWASPTYGMKVPALSFNVEVRGQVPLTVTTTWTLPK